MSEKWGKSRKKMNIGAFYMLFLHSKSVTLYFDRLNNHGTESETAHSLF